MKCPPVCRALLLRRHDYAGPARGAANLKIAVALAAVLCALPARAATNIWLPAGPSTNDWHDTNNWNTFTVPAPGDDVRITNNNVNVMLTNSTDYLSSILLSNNCTLVFSNWNTSLSATNVNLFGGTATHAPESAADTNGAGQWVPDSRVWIVCSNLTIGAGAAINVNGRGYRPSPTNYGYGRGPGGGIRRGGSYGGRGTVVEHPADSITYSGDIYGAADAPLDPGSGGGQWNGPYPGGYGGGAARIQADGTVTVNGTLTANGNNAQGGGGSGGAIYITCLTLAGTNGLIAANGGSSISQQADGGGGRIAVFYDTNAQVAVPAVRFRAAGGGTRFNYANASFSSSIGTLYFPDTRFLTETFSHAGWWTVPGFTNWAPNNLIVSNGWLGLPGSGFRLSVTGDIIVIGGSIYSNQLEFSNAVITCGDDLLLTNAALTLHRGVNTGATLNVGGDMTLADGSAMYVYGAETNDSLSWSASVGVAGNVAVASNAWINTFSHQTNGGSAWFQMKNLSIAAGGGIDADYRGFRRGGGGGPYGPGAGIGSGRGGGYGGRGGGASPGGGLSYGSSNAPVHAGSGGHRQSSVLAGNGGGVIRIEASQNVTVNGSLLASGQTASGNIGGGGAGGSIYVVCGRFQGDGALTAMGGVSSQSGTTGGGGGGGRIAVWRVFDDSSVSADVSAGAGTGVASSNGTIVWGRLPQPGTLFTVY